MQKQVGMRRGLGLVFIRRKRGVTHGKSWKTSLGFSGSVMAGFIMVWAKESQLLGWTGVDPCKARIVYACVLFHINQFRELFKESVQHKSCL